MTSIDRWRELVKESNCPFDVGDPHLAPEDPCPVCGELGTAEALVIKSSKCVSPFLKKEG